MTLPMSNDTLLPLTPADRTLAILCHIGGLVFTWVPPLFIYLSKKSEPQAVFDTRNALEALNFQITVMLAYLVAGLVIDGLLGWLFIGLVGLINLVLSLTAAYQASQGRVYRYALSWRLVK